MKNLKKVLALGLSATMVSSMFVTAGAAFSDQKDIKATDAVNMLSALGVINGYEDGSYKPETVVTRAEMAKMIFVVRNNKVDDSAYQNVSTKFADIKGHWAAGYIKFCESQGIIAGKTATQFDPDSPVTGVEAAKMLLVLTGYTPDKAGLTGSMWATNTLRFAAEAGILDDVNSALEQGLPRQYAAQQIYNTLDAYRVKWSTDSNSFDYITSGLNKEKVGAKYMGLSTDVGVLTDLSKDSLTIKIDSTYSSDNYHSGSTQGFTKVKEDYTKFLGQKVKVMFKDGKTNNVLGVYSISDNAVYATKMNKVEQDGDKIKFGGTSYSLESNKKIATTFIGVDGTTTADQTVAYFDKGSAANADGSNGNTSLDTVTFVDSDGNGKIDTAIVVESNAAEVTSVSSSKITFGGKSYDFADETIDENIAKDDWAVMSKNLYNDNKNITKADVLVTTVNAYKYKNANYSQYQLDGSWYNIATAVKDDAGVSTGDSVKAYVVNGVIVKMKSDDGKGGFPTNVGVVVGKGGSGSVNGDQARIRFFDGTSKVVTISDDNKTTLSTLGKAYKISGSDSSMKFENLSAQKYNSYLYAGTDKDALPGSDTIGGTKVDDSAAIILFTAGGNSKQITGKQFNALADKQIDSNGSTAAKSVFTKDVNGLTRVMMASVLVTNTNVTGKSSDNYAYITADAVENANGDMAYTIWTTDNQYVKVTEESTYSSGERAKGTLIGYSAINSSNIIQDVDKIGTIKGGTKIVNGSTFTDGELYYGGNASEATKTIAVENVKFNVTADTKVLFVDSDGDDIGQEYTYGSTSMVKAQKFANGDYTRNVLIVADETGKDDIDIKALVLDTTGAFKGFKVDAASPSTPDADTSVSGNITVTGSTNVAAKTVATSIDTANNLTIALAAGSDVTVGVTVNGIAKTASKATVGSQDQYTVAGVAKTDTVKITITDNTYAVTGITVPADVTSTSNGAKYTITSDKATAIKGETVTLTITLDKAVPTGKKVTVDFSTPDVADVVLAEGATTATATFKMATSAVTVAVTSVTEAAK